MVTVSIIGSRQKARFLPLLLLALGFAFLGICVSVRLTQPELQPLHIQDVERAGCSPREQVVVDYEREFPYEMTCSYFGADNLNYRKNVTIALAYHVGMVNNWRDVVRDQLHTLHQCGLGHAARHMLLSYSGRDDEMDQISELMEPFDFSFHLVRVVQPKSIPWEGAIMNAIHQYCKKRPEAVMYYFHNKGVSWYGHKWRNNTGKSFTYSRVLYWRKFMEYFTLERPQLCLEEILGKNASACGVNFWPAPDVPHFSGNIWVASCKYLAALPPLDLTRNLSYVAAEFWIGKKYNLTGSRFVNLWQRKLNAELLLYRHWIQPSEYRFPEDLLNVSNVTL
jgi:hypothetical protein